METAQDAGATVVSAIGGLVGSIGGTAKVAATGAAELATAGAAAVIGSEGEKSAKVVESTPVETVEETTKVTTTTVIRETVVITLTRSTLEEGTDKVLESSEVELEIPGFAQGSWWALFVAAVTRRHSSFDVVKFLTALAARTDDAITEVDVLADLHAAGASVSAGELSSIWAEAGVADWESFARLLAFLRVAVQTVSVELVIDQVAPLLLQLAGEEVTTTTQTVQAVTGTEDATQPTVVVEELSSGGSGGSRSDEFVVVEGVTTERKEGLSDTSEIQRSEAADSDVLQALVITLTQQTLDESNQVVSSRDVTLEIPPYAMGTWWNALVATVTGAHAAFEPRALVTSLSESGVSLTTGDDTAVTTAGVAALRASCGAATDEDGESVLARLRSLLAADEGGKAAAAASGADLAV
ncbi:hypothetical protein HK405_016054, partial [Cladochytrium tenue]